MGLIHGLDGNGNLVPLLLGPSGDVIVNGQTPSGTPTPIVVDAQGHLIVDGVDAAGTNRVLGTDANGFLTISGRTAGAVRTPILSDGSGRQYIAVKGDDKVWSYDSAFAEVVQNLTLAAGNNILAGTVVPAGKVLVVTSAITMYSGTLTNVVLYIQAVIGGVGANISGAKPTVNLLPVGGPCHVVLAAGDKMQALITGETLNDDGYLQYAGYFMEAP